MTEILARELRATEDERLIIGCCLRWPELVADLRRRLSSQDFYPGPSQEAMRALEAVADRGEPTIWTSVTSELRRRQPTNVDLASGAYLLDCVTDSLGGAAVRLEWHALNVLRAAQRRRLLQAGQRVEFTANDLSLSADDAVRHAQEIIAGVGRSATAGPQLLDPMEMAMVAAIHNDNRDQERPLPFGLLDLDRKVLGGARRGQLVIVGGRTGMGKSALLRLMGRSFAQVGPTLYASNEMTAEQLAQRDLAALSGIALGTVIERTYSADAEARVVGAEASIGLMPLYNLIDWGLTSASLRTMARELHARVGLRAIVVDYLQKMADPGRTDLERVGHATRELKSLALELNLPVVAGAQINRRGESPNGDTASEHRPGLTDLRDTGEIEQTADVVLLLYRANARYQANGARGDNTAEIIIAKQRQGEAGTMVKVAWLPSIATFANLARRDGDER